MNSAPGIVAGSIGLMVINVTVEFAATPVAPFPGRCDVTTGALSVGSAAVVNVLRKSASELPARSLTPLVATTEIPADGGKVVVSCTERPSDGSDIPAPIRVDPLNKARVVEFTVLEFTGSENVRMTVAFRPMPVALFGGLTDTTAGGVVSAEAAVVNWKKKLVELLPARSWTNVFHGDCTLTVALPGSALVGVRVTVEPLTEAVAGMSNVPVFGTEAAIRIDRDKNTSNALTDPGLMASLKFR